MSGELARNPEAERLGVLQAFMNHCGQFAVELVLGEDLEQLKKMPGRTTSSKA